MSTVKTIIWALMVIGITSFGLKSPVLCAAAQNETSFSLPETKTWMRQFLKLFLVLSCAQPRPSHGSQFNTESVAAFSVEPCLSQGSLYQENYDNAGFFVFDHMESPLSVVCNYHVCNREIEDKIECCRTMTNSVVECVEVNRQTHRMMAIKFNIIETTLSESIRDIVVEQGYHDPHIFCELADTGMNCLLEKGSLGLPVLPKNDKLLAKIRKEIIESTRLKNINLFSDKYFNRTGGIFSAEDFEQLNNLFKLMSPKFNLFNAKIEVQVKSMNAPELKSASTCTESKTVYFDTQLLLDENIYHDDESLIMTIAHELGHNKQGLPLIVLNESLVTSESVENIPRAYKKYFNEYLAHNIETNADILGYFGALYSVDNWRFLPQHKMRFFKNFLAMKQALNPRREPAEYPRFPTLITHPAPLVRYATLLELHAKMEAVRRYFAAKR